MVKGRYRILGPATACADVVTYAAEAVATQQRVVLAVVRGDLASDAEFVSAVREQAYRLAKTVCQHATLVRVYDTGTTDEGELFVALEPVVGRSLRELLDERGVLATHDALRFAIQVGEGLETLHRNGIVHGELRPESVLLVRDDNGEAVKLVGVELTAARRTAAGRPRRDETAGAYLAPEQRGEADTTEASDVYALGLLILEMLTGQRPDGAGRRQPAEIPPAIARIVAKSLERGPARRYSSMSLMLNDLWSVDGQPSTSPVPIDKSSEAARARRSTGARHARSDVGMATALVVGLLLVGVTAAWVVRTERFARRAAVETTEPLVAASPVAPSQPPAAAPPVATLQPPVVAPPLSVAPAPNVTEPAPVTAPQAPASSRGENGTVAVTPPVEETRARVVPAKPATVGAVRAPKPVARQAERPASVEPPSTDGADGTAIIDWLLKGGRSGG